MKIVIVGGGTAGWLAAASLANQNALYKEDNHPQHEVIVIDSSKIPIIGSGEGSTGLLTEFITTRFGALKRSEVDFFYGTKAVPKYGIKFKDWNGVGTEFLSPIQPSQTADYSYDADFLSCAVEGNYADASLSGYLMGKNLSDFHVDNKKNIKVHGYHFDAHEVGKYLKSICISNGITHIDSTIKEVNIDSITGECSSVDLENGTNINADLWIDCTGFSRLLINKVGGKWISYSNELPTNSALPYIHKYNNPYEAKLETLAWAMPNGWMWQIPTQERYGCGYVYCDRFVSQDKALEELQTITGRQIEPLRNLKFDAGRVDKFWIKNVVAMGLSSSFLEPLQATSIHSTLIQIDALFSNYLCFDKESMFLEQNIKNYNKFISYLIDDFKDLIRVHYANGRQDTEFWRFCNNELPMSDKVKEVIEMCKYRSPSNHDFGSYYGVSGWGVWCWSLVGLGILPMSSIKNTLDKFSMLNYTKEKHNNVMAMNKRVSISFQNQPEFIRNLIKKNFK
jgi:tryptophan halogenase